MKIVAGLLLLIVGASAYPIAESDVETSALPLVITDYSSVAKAEDQVTLSVPHGKAGHVHDSEESESAESAEIEKPKDDKKEEKSIESSEERVMQDGISASTLIPIENKKNIKEEDEAVPKPEGPSLSTETKKEIKSEDLNNKEAPKLEKAKDEKNDVPPALKSIPVEDFAKVSEKLDIKDEVTVPLGKSDVSLKAIQEKKTENQAATELGAPLALPASRKDLPAEPTKAEEILPSEQKVEASPVAEEILPLLKSTENLEKKSVPSTTETLTERKEAVPEKREESAEKPEDNKVEQIKELEKKPEDTKEETKEEITPAEVPQGKSASIPQVKPEEKKTVDMPGILTEESLPAKKSLPESEEIKVEKKSLLETPNETSVSESKPIETTVEKAQEKPKEDEKANIEEPKATAKSIEDIKPEEKKSDVSTEKLPISTSSS